MTIKIAINGLGRIGRIVLRAMLQKDLVWAGSPVEMIAVNDHAKLRAGGSLPDIAPTMLEILNLPKPPEMTGESLLLRG